MDKRQALLHTTLQDATPPQLPPSARDGKYRRLPLRAFKIVLVIVFGVVTLRALVSEQGYIGTNNAVLSSVVTMLRAPIEGYITAGDVSYGQPVKRSTIVETILNVQPNDADLTDLQGNLQHIRRQREAALSQRRALSTLLTQLVNRAAADNAAQVARISANIQLYRAKMAAAVARRDQMERDYQRKLVLLNSGTAAEADVDRLRSDFVGATQDAAAALAAMQVEVTARDAAQDGFLVDPGANDVNYATQRADELRILLTQIDRSVADLDADAEQARERLRNHLQHEKANIIAPISGMIWRVGALNGERVSPGDVVLEMVDCRHAFMLASIPQYRIPDVSVGMQARFKFVGEASEHVARVTSIESDGLTERGARLAAAPLPERTPSAIVTLSVLSMPKTPGECLVGRTARVLLPLRQGGLVYNLALRLGLDHVWHWLGS
jgi:multidrug resistance efflux pump